MHEFYTITDGELFVHSDFKFTFTESIVEAIKFKSLMYAKYYTKKLCEEYPDDIDLKVLKVTCTLAEVED